MPWSGTGWRCLDVGSGEGGLSLWLALRGHHVVCSNHEIPSTRAEALHARHGVRAAEYRELDATSLPYENEFDLVVFKSMLGAVGSLGKAAQQRAIDQIHRALKPGGRLLFVDNAAGSPLHRAARALKYRGRNVWRFIPPADFREFLRAFSRFEVHTTGFAAAFGLNERQRNLLAHVDGALLNHITPEAWRYVVYGLAVK